MITISRGAQNVVVVDAPLSMTPIMRAIPGARFHRATDQWHLPHNLQTRAALRSFDSDGVFSGLDGFNARQESRRTCYDAIAAFPHLYPFQAAGVRFLAGGRSVLMADEMGTGKTIQALAAVALEDAWPLLVVCPNSLKHNWKNEIKQWTTATPFVIEGTARQRRDRIEEAAACAGPTAVIINYESLVLHAKQAPFGNTVLSDKQVEPKELDEFKWSAVVVDEAHRIKNPKAATTRAVWSIGETANYRFALTGTPIVNNPDDLWSVMRFVRPDEYPSRSRFRERYCVVAPGWFGGVENRGIKAEAREEFDTLFTPRFVRRTKAEVLPQLPEKIFTERLIPLAKAQQKVYNELLQHMMAQVEGGVLAATDPLTLLGKLRYTCNGVPVLDGAGEVTALTGPSNKLAEILSLIEDTEGPLVVYAQSRKFIEYLERELDGAVSITGKKSGAQRQLAVDDFQAGRADLLLATTGAGAEGLTLTRANRLVMASEDWSNVANKQAHDRIHRIGQERGVEIITLVSKGTVEEAVRKTTDRKENMLQELVRDKEALLRFVRGWGL